MAERTEAGHIWMMRGTYLFLVYLIVLFHLIPIETMPGLWPAPDLLVALTFVWALRRPAFVPLLLVAVVFLLADLMFQRPPGLWAALVVAAVEWLKSRARTLRDVPFTLELASAVGVLVAITLIYRVVLTALLLPVPSLGLTLMQLAFTAAVMPVVMVASRFLLGLRRVAPGEVDVLGQRI